MRSICPLEMPAIFVFLQHVINWRVDRWGEWISLPVSEGTVGTGPLKKVRDNIRNIFAEQVAQNFKEMILCWISNSVLAADFDRQNNTKYDRLATGETRVQTHTYRSCLRVTLIKIHAQKTPNSSINWDKLTILHVFKPTRYKLSK